MSCDAQNLLNTAYTAGYPKLSSRSLLASHLALACQNKAAVGPPQILAYSTYPSVDGVTPGNLNATAIAVKPGGTTYIWDPVLHYWDDGGLLLDLVGYYTFDTDGTDSIGGNTTTIGTGSVIGPGGIINSCLQVTSGAAAGAQIASVPGPYQVGASTPFTYSLWFNPGPSQNGFAMLVSVYDATAANQSFYTYLLSNSVRMHGALAGNKVVNIASTGVPVTNQWNHVAFGYDPANSRIWIMLNGGTMFNSGPLAGTMNPGNAAWWVGNSSLSTSWFQGGIDELAVWQNRVLRPAEVAAIYNAGAGLPLSAYPKKFA